MSVKYCENGELSHGRKEKSCDSYFASRCACERYASFFVHDVKGGFFMQFLLELKGIPRLVKESAKEMKKVSSLCGASLLTALNTAVEQFTIILSDFLQIGFSSVMAGVCGFYYGPVLSAFAGGCADIIKYLIHPVGAFFPGFTLSEIVLGFLYGVCFYKKEITLKRVIFARICNTIIINLLMTSLWLSMMYGKTFWAYLSLRLVKNIVLLPIDIAILYFILKFAQKNPAIKKH